MAWTWNLTFVCQIRIIHYLLLAGSPAVSGLVSMVRSCSIRSCTRLAPVFVAVSVLSWSTRTFILSRCLLCFVQSPSVLSARIDLPILAMVVWSEASRLRLCYRASDLIISNIKSWVSLYCVHRTTRNSQTEFQLKQTNHHFSQPWAADDEGNWCVFIGSVVTPPISCYCTCSDACS